MPIIQQGGGGSCLVTGNLQTLGATFSQGTVVFQLYNIGQGTIPEVLGVTLFNSLKYVVVSDPRGNISVSLWGNDIIDPANTVYLVTLRDFYGNEVGPIMFSIVGSSFNLNTATPITSVLPPIYTNGGYASGAPVSPLNFVISGWGTGATVSNVQGVQQRCSITVTAGATPSVAPTVVFTYPGPYQSSSWNLSQIIGGTGIITDILSVGTATNATFTYDGLPALASTYIFVFDTVGI